MKNIKNKLPIILLIIGVIAASGFSFHFWRANQRTKSVNNLLFESLIEANKLVKNSNTAYKVFGDCMADQDTCDVNVSVEKLIELNGGKQNIEKKFQEIQIKLQPFLRK